LLESHARAGGAGHGYILLERTVVQTHHVNQ
jgi:hypothetical protein